MAEEKIVVAVDAMGGDNAPGEIVKGAVQALEKNPQIHLKIVGLKEKVEAELGKYPYDKSRVEVIPATEVIETGESPVMAIRKKKDSSLVLAMKLVKEGSADALVSAGSSGAILVGGQTIVGRIKGIERAPLAPLIPTAKGMSLLIDAGANMDAKSSYLVQFAKMGSIYMEHVVGVKNPKVAIVNVGAEEEKGNALVKETFPLLKACTDINFVGSVEAREIPSGDVDVIVCDAFVGNVILKLYEGLGMTLISKIKGSMMASLKTKIGALLIKKSLKQTLKGFMSNEYGGAPLLGLNGLVVKAHGNSTAVEICNSIQQCITFRKQRINDKIREKIKKEDEMQGES